MTVAEPRVPVDGPQRRLGGIVLGFSPLGRRAAAAFGYEKSVDYGKTRYWKCWTFTLPPSRVVYEGTMEISTLMG
jgi:hypothetical protein